MAEIAGRGLPRAFSQGAPQWIALVAAGEVLTYPAYLLAYRSVGRLGGKSSPPLSALARVVVAGFGPIALGGGFAVDARAWRSLRAGSDADTDADARRFVHTMATLEWTILAPATWGVAVALLLERSPVSPSVVWPWAAGVPAGLIAATWISSRPRHDHLSSARQRRLTHLTDSVASALTSIRAIATHPRQFAGAWLGMSLYWAAEIAAFTGALRTAGVPLGIDRALLAYATGYLGSRRSLPLGGAGLTEAMLVFALCEMSVKVGPAVFAVLIYRMFNFLMALGPALLADRAT